MKKVLKPDLDERLAEFLGLQYGDGSLSAESNGTYRLVISLNLEKDKEYSIWVCHVFKQLFGLEFSIDDQPWKSLRMLRCCSKSLLLFLDITYGVPVGKKTQLKIPSCVLESSTLSKAFIRGVFDTDGCTYIRKTSGYEYPVIKITTAVQHFAMQLCMKLNEIGFRARIQEKHEKTGVGYDVVLNGWNQVRLWKQKIGTRNSRNYLVKGARGI